MSKIIKKSFDKTIDYGNDTIDIFKKEIIEVPKKDNLEIIKKLIINAKETIFIASTTDLDSSISGELQKSINSGIRVYMIFSDFKKAGRALSIYGKNSLIREVKDLYNNFIVIDKSSSLIYFDDLFNVKKNQFIELNDKRSRDLFYWATYYFWMESSLEMIEGIPQKVSKSAFHIPKDIQKENINISGFNKNNFDEIYLPLIQKSKERYQNNNLTFKDLYLNPNNKINIGIKNGNSYLGNIEINQNISNYIVERWKLYKEVKLEGIDYEMIPFDKNWDEKSTIKIKNSKEIIIPMMEAKTIEEIDKIIPNFIKYKEKYIKAINYKWNVTPPRLNKKSKKSKYYKEWSDLQNDFSKKLQFLNNIADNMAKGDGVKEKFKGFFNGKKRKMKEALSTINEYEDIILSEMNKNEADEFLNKEFVDFYNKIIKSQKEYKEEIDKREQEDKFNTEKKKREEDISDIERKILYNIKKKKDIKIESERKRIELKEITLEKKRNIKNKIKRLEEELESLKKENIKKQEKKKLEKDNKLKKDFDKKK